ncbi:aldehyde dehydrogenase (NADP(+)) [Paracoccus sediminis]|uniref:Aldehyde dehydrogenase (NADP(+)) n=1 Tax=Paracoccus sediminis TaxID=1214787 RepID=A0A238XAC9_9RHOB|nr:aldehyde dehydrogenase (NADP(+)) [Paracoccus sediminis]TBN48972.1 aldehyde dehydrogenase (NADP(+)) [Paracoccus sediminis]SNR54809.1 NADP-dependent aldehyde dehydrogenase [Paracoccus sediminis]
MTFTPHGKHLVAGEWLTGEGTFRSAPVHGDPHEFSGGTVDLVDRAALAAEDAFAPYAATSRDDRAAFLDAIADQIEGRAEAITAIGTQETGLPEARLQGERGRTTGQLRLFADHIRKGEYLDRRHDPAMPERQPLPRPDLRLMQRPIGPVAVFGASNFPLAFSTAGGDTASALAAGCPVVVKGHPAHPGTGEIVAEAIRAAIRETGMPAGVFGFIHGDSHAVGAALVQHPLIKAVGFTGSLRGGRALFDLCAARPEPIPFFGELGSINPGFVLPQALAARGARLAEGWAGSLTMGAGQFCTNPGLIVMPKGVLADAFAKAVGDALAKVAPQPMLTDGIADAYREGANRAAGVATPIFEGPCEGRNVLPAIYKTTAEEFLRDHTLSEEVFGPMGVIVTTTTEEQMMDVAQAIEGQLTATLHMDEADIDMARRLMPVLERKAGRILANGWPTGVEVADAMVHGGPYPASTNFGATSVGTMAIRRFLRPVSYQNIPEALLPEDLRGF